MNTVLSVEVDLSEWLIQEIKIFSVLGDDVVSRNAMRLTGSGWSVREIKILCAIVGDKVASVDVRRFTGVLVGSQWRNTFCRAIVVVSRRRQWSASQVVTVTAQVV
jgi:hypothetical protein